MVQPVWNLVCSKGFSTDFLKKKNSDQTRWVPGSGSTNFLNRLEGPVLFSWQSSTGIVE
jgi:hypothetical protein